LVGSRYIRVLSAPRSPDPSGDQLDRQTHRDPPGLSRRASLHAAPNTRRVIPAPPRHGRWAARSTRAILDSAPDILAGAALQQATLPRSFIKTMSPQNAFAKSFTKNLSAACRTVTGWEPPPYYISLHPPYFSNPEVLVAVG
jgi:hypothetical protein